MHYRHYVNSAHCRVGALAVTVLVACGDPEPSVPSSDGSTELGSSSGDSSGQPGGGSSQDVSETGAPTGESTDASSSTTAIDTSETGAAAPTFSEIHATIFAAKGCLSTYCHGGMAHDPELLDEATAYANLVGVAASQASCGASVRVVPGAPEESVLWLRVRPAALEDGEACGAKMPLGSSGLEDADARRIYNWIAAGAPE
jgi:hypothetical protein